MEHKKYTHVCVLKYALYVYPAKSRARTRVYLTPARHLGPAGFSAVKLIGSLLFVGTLPEAHHAAQGRHAWSTFRERPGRRTHTHRDVRSSQDSATRMATRERSRKVSQSRTDSTPQVILRPQTRTRPDLLLFTELYTQSITTAMERRLEIFLRLEVRRFTPTRGAVELAVADWR